MTNQRKEPTVAEKRKKVSDLLSQKDFQKAYNLVRDFNLHEPWRGFCSYCLAHFIMSADSEDHSGIAPDRLFQEAAAAKFLGPFPLIYRLAALERADLKNKREFRNAFKNAVDALRQLPISERLDEDERNLEYYGNMLRLAAYYFGYPVEPSPIVTPSSEESYWVLVGNDSNLAKPKLTKGFVLEEMESLCDKYPNGVFFKISEKDFYREDELERHWKLGKRSWYVMQHYPALKLLSLLLRGRHDTIDGLKDRLSATDNTFAKIKERLKKGLSDLLQMSDNDIFISKRGQFPRINPDILIFGAVET